MPIVTKSNGIINRQHVCQYLEEKKAQNPGFRVLDIGGTANNWCDKYVDAYVDILPAPNKTTYLGDINAEAVWREIAKEKWDFCICTHVLEDIRAPDFVIARILETFPAGFISMPNKHAELSHVESRFFLGWSHHRWIYTIDNDQLKAIAKMPVVQFFSKKNSFYHQLCSIPGVARVLRFRKGLVPAIDGRLKWIDPKISRGDCELAFIWQEEFKFSFINNDFAGLNTIELAQLYLYDLSHGL
jgi:hypothetical protein